MMGGPPILALICLLAAAELGETAQLGPVFLQEPPSKADFTNSSGLTLQCTAHGNPQPKIKWVLLDGREAKDVPGLRRMLPNGTLLLEPFTAVDFQKDIHTASYRCTATNSAGTIMSRISRVRAAVVKEDYEPHVRDAYAMCGTTAVLHCIVPSFVRDYVSVTSWQRGSHERIITDTEIGGRYSVFPSGELHIRNTRPEDGDLSYRCEVQHHLTGEYKLSIHGARLWLSAPKNEAIPHIVDSRGHVEARHREPVEVPCAAQGNPIPTYNWFRVRAGVSVPLVVDARVRQVGGSLFFSSPEVGDSGRYMCVANNTIGTDRSSTTFLVSAPLSAYINPQSQTVDMGRGAQLNCTTEGHPQVGISWLKDGQKLTITNRRRLIVPQILRIDNVDGSDRGMYQCVVYNNDETAQGTAELRLGDMAPTFLSRFAGVALRQGGTWSVLCEATGFPLPTVSWRHDGRPIASEERHLQVTMQATVVSVKSRLTVSGARLEDAGEYECVASNVVGRARHSAGLVVLGPPRVRPMQDRRVVARTDPVFHCRVLGHPISQIRWERKGKNLPENHRQQVFPNGTLVIKNIQKNTDEGGYVCIATNPDGHTSRSKLNIQILEPPEIDPIAVKSDLQEGMRMHLTCVVRKGDFPISILWLRDGAVIPRGEKIYAQPYGEYSSILSFAELNISHTGNYTCQATNAAAVTNYTVEIIVNDPPSWTIEPTDTETVVGETVFMPCAAEGSPTPNVTWKRDTGAIPPLYQDLSHVMANYKIMQNGSLIIYDTIPEDTGYYLCEATNDIGLGLSKVVLLVVHVPAKILKPFQNVTAMKGTYVTINCTAEGDKPISIMWYQRNKEFSAINNPRMGLTEKKNYKGMISTLTFKNVDKDDTSLFACVAKNKYGIDRSEAWLYVQEPPEAPLYVRISNYSSRSVDVMWEQPYNGNSPIKTYIIQYKNSSVAWHKNVAQVVVDGDILSVSITDLMPAHAYNIRVLAENSVGMSNSSDVLTITTLEEVPEAPPRDVKVKTKDSVTLLVTWKPPDLYLQHGEIKGYYIGYKKANSTESFHYKTYDTHSGMPLQYTLTDLEKYTQYTVLVQAYNKIGAGPRSKEVIGATDEDVPGAPPNDLQCASLTSQSILVLWSPLPISVINGILRGYKVLYKALCYGEGVSAPSEHVTTDQKVELKKLEHFCNYSVQVQAFTRKGDGVISEPIFCRTHEDVPNEPEDIKAAVTDSRSILISWLPPLYPNGIIRSYKVYVRSLEGMAMDTDEFDVPADRTHHIVSPLKKNTKYEFWVTAITTVGEGAESRHVVQAPASTAPAKIASFGQHINTALRDTLKLSCHAVGHPIPHQYWTKNGNPIEEDGRIHISDDWLLQLTSVRSTDAGNYSCSAENIYGNDKITYNVVVQVTRAPTNLHASTATVSSISLKWLPSSDTDHKIQGQFLYYKREFGEWERIKVKADATEFTLENLQCGTKYYFYLEAFIQRRFSEPTPTIAAFTQGSAPIAPHIDDLIQVNSSFILLNLTAWDDGQCPITSFVIEYSQKNSDSWTLVSNNIKTEHSDFIILDLNPGTWYTLRVTAHNSAGSTVEKYDFTTLNHFGATAAPDLDILSENESKPFYTDVGIVTAIVVGLTFAVIVAIILFIWLRRHRMAIPSNTYTAAEKPQDTGQLSVADNRATQNTYVTSNNGNNDNGKDISEPTYVPSPTSTTPAHRQNISPYATFQVPVSDGSDIEVEPEVEDVSHKRRVSKCDSTDSTYSRIHEGYQRGNENREWVPLHNLYQAHRY